MINSASVGPLSIWYVCVCIWGAWWRDVDGSLQYGIPLKTKKNPKGLFTLEVYVMFKTLVSVLRIPRLSSDWCFSSLQYQYAHDEF